MTDFPWLAKYPKGVPAQINPDRVANIPALLDGIAEKHPNAPAFTNMGVTLTTKEAQALSFDLAGYLQSLPDMQKGDRVAVPSSPICHFEGRLHCCECQSAVHSARTRTSIERLRRQSDHYH